MIDEPSRREIKSFQSLWPGGYFEGDPLDPLGPSSYGRLGYVSVLHAAYLVCIKPYVGASTVALEIGPGRGAWTKCLLGARAVYCLDALSAEHNGFWRYVGQQDHVTYAQVSDLTASVLPDDGIDYMFSFGTFCHLSPASVEQYLRHLHTKLRSGAHAFVMYADYDKYNHAIADRQVSIDRVLPRFARPALTVHRVLHGGRTPPTIHPDRDMEAVPGRWYNMGTKRMVELLESIGYLVVDADVGVNHRDPVAHFIRP